MCTCHGKRRFEPEILRLFQDKCAPDTATEEALDDEPEALVRAHLCSRPN